MSVVVQQVTISLTNIYNTFKEDLAATLSNTSSSATASLLSTASATTLTLASECEREDDGSLRVQFYASAENITREVDGLLAGGRRLQSTPCSASDGTSVSVLPNLPLHCDHWAVLCCAALCCAELQYAVLCCAEARCVGASMACYRCTHVILPRCWAVHLS